MSLTPTRTDGSIASKALRVFHRGGDFSAHPCTSSDTVFTSRRYYTGKEIAARVSRSHAVAEKRKVVCTTISATSAP